MSRDPVTAPPVDDADITAWTAALGLDGLIDLHVHFLPDQVMAKVWGFFDQAGLLAEAGVPVVVHCGNGPVAGPYTGLEVFGEVLAAHPRLVAVLAHAGLPEYDSALELVRRYPEVHLDTTMVGVPFTDALAPLPPDWPARLVDVADRIALGTDFPNIPYDYATQLRAIAGWAAADDRLGAAFLRAVVYDTPGRLLQLDAAGHQG